jgi:hypothetical protein
MTTIDTLETWEKWPVAALVAAAGLNTAIWYAGDVLPVEARGILPWLITVAAIASVVAIDGSLIATIAGRRQGRRNRWGVANICVTALFTALAALSAHSAIVGIAPWLHGLFAATIVTYAMHLEQPRADVGIALALREQELTRREQDVNSREQSAAHTLASADNYLRQAEQEIAQRRDELTRREQQPIRIEQVETIKVASAELTWRQFEQVIKKLTSDAPSMSSLRRLVASIEQEVTE